MSQPNVEKRISALEQTVAELLRLQRPTNRAKDWRRTIGMFSGNDLMKEIDAAGQKIRERDRRQARQRGSKRTRKKK
jgi:hypothetical protein